MSTRVRLAFPLACLAGLLTACDQMVEGQLRLAPPSPADPVAEYERADSIAGAVSAEFGFVERVRPSAQEPYRHVWGDGNIAVELRRDDTDAVAVTISEFPSARFSERTAEVWASMQRALRRAFGSRVVVTIPPKL